MAKRGMMNNITADKTPYNAFRIKKSFIGNEREIIFKCQKFFAKIKATNIGNIILDC